MSQKSATMGGASLATRRGQVIPNVRGPHQAAAATPSAGQFATMGPGGFRAPPVERGLKPKGAGNEIRYGQLTI